MIQVGNFNAKLRECEDQDLGDKLLNHRYKLLSDPNLIAYSLRKETLSTLYLRYRRWHSHYQTLTECNFTIFRHIKNFISYFCTQRMFLKKCLSVH